MFPADASAQRRLEKLAGHLIMSQPESDGLQLSDVAAEEPASWGDDRFDIIVVGAGAVGCPLAVALGKQGRKVLVCERDLKEPDRIVGELLQPGGVETLRKLGMERVLDGMDAVREFGYCVFYQGKPVHLPYPKPYQGASFHHGRFIQNLRAEVRAIPNIELRQCTVTSLIEEGGVVQGVSFSQGKRTGQAFAPLTFIVDGCFSKFRAPLGGPQPTATSSFVGMVLKMPVDQMVFPQHGHVILADPSPILLYALTPTEIRCLVDVPHPVPSSSGGVLRRYMEERILPQLPEPFREPFRTALYEDRLRSMPNNQMSAKQTRRPGVMLLGDSLNMRHPLTGGGMTVGITDAYLLTERLRGVDLRSHGAVAAAVAKFEGQRTPLAATINILAMALYRVFSASGDKMLPAMREACFAYFVLGGICAEGPVRLLAGLTPNYWVLIGHFFAVALYGCGRIVLPVPTPGRIAKAAQLVMAATRIIAPLIAAERITFLNSWPFREIALGLGAPKEAASPAPVAAAAAAAAPSAQ